MASKLPLFEIFFFLFELIILNFIYSFVIPLRDEENKLNAFSHFIFYIIGGLILGASISKLLEYTVQRSYGTDAKLNETEKTWRQDVVLLIYCILGKFVCLAVWSEIKIFLGNPERFIHGGTDCSKPGKSFVNFMVNIILMVFSSGCILFQKRISLSIPLYKWAYCSFADILQHLCFTESLKNISYLSQISGTSLRLLPVMLFSKILLRKDYNPYEYGTSFLITLGMGFILYSMIYFAPFTEELRRTNLLGFGLLSGSLLFEGFSPVWTFILMTKHKMSYIHAICGKCLFNAIYYAVVLSQEVQSQNVYNCFTMYPDLVIDYFFISWDTLAKTLVSLMMIFWCQPETFVIFGIVSQAVQVLWTAAVSYHEVPTLGIAGALILSVTIFLSIYFKQIKINMIGYSTHTKEVLLHHTTPD